MKRHGVGLPHRHSVGEPPGNVGAVCPDHAPKPDPQYFTKPLEWFIGKTVKLGFPVGHKGLEHMWVEVKGPGDAADLKGLLANDSIFDVSLLEGAEIHFDRTDVEAVWEY